MTYREYIESAEFLVVVRTCRSRSRGRCERCRRVAATQPHHVRYCKWGDVDTPENIEMLCFPCHENAHRCSGCGEVRLKARHIKNKENKCDECKNGKR